MSEAKLNGNRLKVAYIIDMPFFQDEQNENIIEQHPQHCLKDRGKTMCGVYTALFKTLTINLNFTIDWIHAVDNNYGVFDVIKSK